MQGRWAAVGLAQGILLAEVTPFSDKMNSILGQGEVKIPQAPVAL